VSVSLIFDIVMIVLLIVMIISCMSLSQRLRSLKDSRKAFEQLAAQFEEATKRADAGIKNLQNAATSTGEGLQNRLEKARALRDELAIMIDSAESLANRLAAVTPSTTTGASSRSMDLGAAAQPSQPAAPAADPRTRAERELFNALRAQQNGDKS
jgi:hypothetical protein